MIYIILKYSYSQNNFESYTEIEFVSTDKKEIEKYFDNIQNNTTNNDWSYEYELFECKEKHKKRLKTKSYG
jgi:hypothetical protein